MKKLLAILVLGLLLSGCATYPNKTEHYNFEDITGPTSIYEAILLLSKKSNLDKIEGVWFDKNNFTIAIIQEDRNYSIYRVAGPGLTKFGYKDGTIFKGESESTFKAREAAAGKSNNVGCVTDASYTLTNFTELHVYIKKCGDKAFKYNRLYPEKED